MKTSEWVVTLLITGIPLVGIIMLIVWALGDDYNITRKNYAKAALILMAIMITLTILFYASLFGVLLSAIMNKERKKPETYIASGSFTINIYRIS